MYMAAKTKVTVVTLMFRKRTEAGPLAKRVYDVPLENNAERGRTLAHSRRIRTDGRTDEARQMRARVIASRLTQQSETVRVAGLVHFPAAYDKQREKESITRGTRDAS